MTLLYTLSESGLAKQFFQTERWKHNIQALIFKCSFIFNTGDYECLPSDTRTSEGTDPGKPTVREGFLKTMTYETQQRSHGK